MVHGSDIEVSYGGSKKTVGKLSREYADFEGNGKRRITISKIFVGYLQKLLRARVETIRLKQTEALLLFVFIRQGYQTETN